MVEGIEMKPIKNPTQKQIEKEIQKANDDVFNSMATSIEFLLHLGYDIKSIEQMIQSTLESAIEQIEDKILNDPKERKKFYSGEWND